MSGGTLDETYSLRVDDQTIELLQELSDKTFRSRAEVVRWLIYSASLVEVPTTLHGFLDGEWSVILDTEIFGKRWQLRRLD